MDQTLDILHPLTSLEWEEWPSLPVEMWNAHSVYLNGTLYVGGGDTTKPGSRAEASLYSFKPGVDSTWTVTDTPTYYYTLVVHDSKLLLVGGYEYPTEEITNKVFTMRDGQFVKALLPMKERRASPSAVSSGSALVVAGGEDTSGNLSSVEVFKNGQWTTAPSLPDEGYGMMQSAIHGDQWYLITYQGEIFRVSLPSLISGSDQPPSWETLPNAPNGCSAVAFFGGSLLSIGGGGYGDDPTTAIYAFFSSTQSWVHVADLPVLGLPTAVVLSSEQLIVNSGAGVLLQGKLSVTPFDADSHFTMEAIYRLEVSAGISVIEELVQRTFPAVAGVNVWEMYDLILKKWASGHGSHPPTWTELFRALKDMGLSKLAGRIEKYLRGSVPEDRPRPPPDEEGVSKEKDEQESLRLNKMLEEYINANTLLKKENIQLKETNTNLEQEIARLKSEEVKEEQLDPETIKEEPTSGNDHQLPSSTLKHIKQETKAEPQTTDMKSEEPVSQLLPLRLSTVQHHAIPFNLPGVEVVASTCVIVTNSSYTFHWVGYGFKLTIPQGSLPAGVDECQLDIKASVAGQYQFPDNLQLVSSVFWIRLLPVCRFQQQLTVEIQHCAKMTSSTKLSFVRAHCSQESLPYTFKQLEGRGSFTKHSSYGSLELSHFCGLAVTGEDGEQREYIASLYYQQCDPQTLDIHFVITWDVEAHITATKEYFEELGAKKRSHMDVEFKKDKIILDIPMNGGVTIGAWDLIPTVSPCIRQCRVDSFKPGRMIRSLRLKATLTRDLGVEIPACSYLVTLDGADEPNQMQIEIDAYRPSKGQDTSVVNQVPPSQALVPSSNVYQPPTPYPLLQSVPGFTRGYPFPQIRYAPYPPAPQGYAPYPQAPQGYAPYPPAPHQWLQDCGDLITMTGRESGTVRAIECPVLNMDQLVYRVGIDEDLLKKECSEKNLKRIAPLLANWLMYAKALELTQSQIQDIDDHKLLSTNEMKTLLVLEKWHQLHAFNATYHHLINVCLSCGHASEATEICKIVKEDFSLPPSITDETTEHTENIVPHRKQEKKS